MRPSPPAVVSTFATAGLFAVCGGCGAGQPAPQAPASSASAAPASQAGASLPEAPAVASAASEALPAPEPAVASSAQAGSPSPTDVAAKALGAIRDAFNAHDAAKVAAQFAPDCVVASYTGPELHGRDDLAADAQKTFAAFPDARSAPLRGWVKGDVVASEVAWTGTMKGAFMGLKPGGRPAGLVALRVIHLTDDGLVKEMHEYGDAAGLVAQMAGRPGAPPPPILPTNDLSLHAAKGTPDEDALVAWAKGLDETFSGDNPKAVIDAMSDDADYWTNFGGPAVKGKRAIEKTLRAWFKAFPDQKWESTGVWGIDGFAIIEHTMTATQKGPFGDRAASKKAVTGWRRVDILQPAVEGTVLHAWGFANVMEILQQTGARKQPR